MEQTLVFIKPDGVKRHIIGRILTRFEEKGLSVSALKMLQLTDELADLHYEEHVDKPFYANLKTFILSGPIVVMILSGEQAISVVRKMVGSTDSASADPGTIRGDFSLYKGENIIHASDSLKNAKREIDIFFDSTEIV